MENLEQSLTKELTSVINRHSVENGSNTPDYILAEYILSCLEVFDRAVNSRADWYGRFDVPGQETAYQPTPNNRSNGG